MRAVALTHTERFTFTADVPVATAFETVERDVSYAWGTYAQGAYFFSATAAFETFYATLTGASPAPAVDFSQFRVVACVDDDRPTSGYDAEIVGLVNTGGTVYDVTVRLTEPDGAAAAVVTKPYHIVKVAIE